MKINPNEMTEVLEMLFIAILAILVLKYFSAVIFFILDNMSISKIKTKLFRMARTFIP